MRCRITDVPLETMEPERLLTVDPIYHRGGMTTRDTRWPDGMPCWTDLGAPDVAKAREFYSDVFSWTFQPGGPETGGYSIAELNGRGVAGVGPKMGPPEAPTMWMTYLATSDADATAVKIKGAGGQLVTEPMDIMDAGRMAVAADPAGAVFGVWQAGAFPGAQIVNEPGAMRWNEQLSRDCEGSKAFYAAIFGYEYRDMSGDGFSYATIKVDGSDVGGIGDLHAGEPAATPATWRVYFGAVDVDALVARVQANGGSVIRERIDHPHGRMSTVADDQGAVFSLPFVTPR
jgi:predicted enzyme related to lactoylglutathione lyase